MFLHAVPSHRDGKYCYRLLVQPVLLLVCHRMLLQLLQLLVLVLQLVLLHLTVLILLHECSLHS
jgi:hypothetical protein